MSQTITVFPFHPGGNFVAFNLTAAAVIKASPGVIYRAIVIAPGTTGGAFTINDSNCIVAAQTITGISQAAQAVITMSTGGGSNPFAVGNTLIVTGAVGMTQINGVNGQVVAIGGVTTAWTATVNINSSAFTAWASGGTAASFAAGNEIWSMPVASTANVAGNTLVLEAPCQQGILLSAVPTTASPILTATYA